MHPRGDRLRYHYVRYSQCLFGVSGRGAVGADAATGRPFECGDLHEGVLAYRPGTKRARTITKHIFDAVHDSLRRLQTDYIDLYQAHRFDRTAPLRETLRAFDDLVRQGKVLYVGVSEWRAEEIEQALQIADELGFDRIVANQPQYNMIWRVMETEIAPLCLREGLGQVVFSPMAQGALTGKYRPGGRPPAGSRATDTVGSKFIRELLADQTLDRIGRLAPLAESCGLSMAQLAIAWTLQNTTVSAAIIGGSQPAQIRENVEAAGKLLDPAVMEEIDRILGDEVVRNPDFTPASSTYSTAASRANLTVPYSQSSATYNEVPPTRQGTSANSPHASAGVR